MGLDVYVGTLTRYHSGQWETIVQQASRAQGIRTLIARSGLREEEPAPIEEVERAVLAWRRAVEAGLQGHSPLRCDWPEGMAPPYFTDKPDWEGYSALMIWAAYAEFPELTKPSKTPSDWRTDPTVQLAQAKDAKGTYANIVFEPELWLPMDFEFTFAGPDPLNNKVQIGSVDALLRELTALNQATWKADAGTITRWRREGLPPDKDLEAGARAAFAMFYELCAEAQRSRLPIRLDY